jgi:ABC-type polar amino acid transport system ATPase subunit
VSGAALRVDGGAELRVDRLTHRHRGATAPTLRDVSFMVPAGTIAAIVGESGAGKTTLLRCLAGLDRAERGTITVGGHVVEGGRGAATLRGRVGLVFQTFELFPHLSVLENCVLGPVYARGVARAGAEATARALLAQLGLAEKTNEHPTRLSGGQCQRVAIARALAMAPACLLYDEPTSALDPGRRRELVEVLSEVRASGITQLVVTHDGALVSAVADLVFDLDGGRLAERPR